jgi:hypothetical protein
MRILLFWWLAWVPLSANASGRLFTYFEGHLVKKSAAVWVISTDEGTYWIDVNRHPNWVRKSEGDEVSFWVATDQVIRYRPLIEMPLHEDRRVENIAQQAPLRKRRRPGG